MRTRRIQPLLIWWIGSFLSVILAASGEQGLADAVKNRNNKLVLTLLQQHADVNAAQGDGSTALHWAASLDDSDTMDLLVAAGANINATNDLGVTPLYLACANGNAIIVAKLLAAGANSNASPVTGVSPLMEASRTGSVDAVRALLAKGANINAKENSAGQTALMWAVAERHPKVIEELVRHRVDLTARSNSRKLFVILNRGGDKENSGLIDPFGDRACGKRDGPCAWIQVGGSTALLFAARNGCVECARILVDGGADVNDVAADGNSALVLATHSGQGAFTSFLLERGANPNSAGAGYAALHAAVLRGDLAVVKALLAHGANPNARYASGTPMRENAPDYALPAALVGGSPFLLAARFASVDMMRVLAAGGADPHATAADGTTPLMAAAGANRRTGGNEVDPPADESQCLEAVKLALDMGNDVNATNEPGNTALHIAAARGHETVVQLLVDQGAKLNIKNKRGLTPLAIALLPSKSSPRFKSTASLLRRLGATE